MSVIVQRIPPCSLPNIFNTWGGQKEPREVQEAEAAPGAIVWKTEDGKRKMITVPSGDSCPISEKLMRRIEVLEDEKYMREYRNRFCDVIDFVYRELPYDLTDKLAEKFSNCKMFACLLCY